MRREKVHTNDIRPTVQRRTRTRGALIAAGEHLFANRSVDAVTIDDIVESADVAKGSFYNHFEDKAALVRAIMDYVQADCEAQIALANDMIDDPAQRMVRALCVVIGYAELHPERVLALTSLSERTKKLSSPLNAGLADDIGDGISNGRFKSITVETGILLAIGVIGTAVAHATAQRSETQSDCVAQLIGAALLRALGCPDPEATTLACDAATELLPPRKIQ